MLIRPAGERDQDAVWSIIAPIIADGEVYALPRGWSRAEALAYWFAPEKEVFLAEADGVALGTSYLTPNKLGGGAHIANAGFATAIGARGRGVAGALGEHTLAQARLRGFRAMQFNFVVSSNTRRCAYGRASASRRSAGCRRPSPIPHSVLSTRW
jgi:GNAT superfamily N-acetyltransferase